MAPICYTNVSGNYRYVSARFRAHTVVFVRKNVNKSEKSRGVDEQ